MVLVSLVFIVLLLVPLVVEPLIVSEPVLVEPMLSSVVLQPTTNAANANIAKTCFIIFSSPWLNRCAVNLPPPARQSTGGEAVEWSGTDPTADEK
jgi:hypothetical protein